MKKTTIYFQKLIRENKDILIQSGIKWSTVRSWAYGQRMPDIENAVRIGEILGMPVEEIPYRQIVINRP